MKVVFLNDIDLRPYVVEKEEGRDTLSFLQELVDGLVESVSVEQGTDIWVNEEGLSRPDFLTNHFASFLAHTRLVGPAVLTGVTKGGETVAPDKYFIKTTHLTHGPETYTASEIIALRSRQLDEMREQGVPV